MSKNYTNYSKPNTQPAPEPVAANVEVIPAVDTVPVTEENIEAIEEANVSAFPVDVEEPEEVTAPAEPITGVVTAAKLNVRSMPTVDGRIVSVIAAGTTVQIDTEASTAEWYKVCTPTGAEGFCMKKFIEV